MGRSRGGLTSKIHALVDAEGRPVTLRLTAGQIADCTEAEALLDRLGEGDVSVKVIPSFGVEAMAGSFGQFL